MLDGRGPGAHHRLRPGRGRRRQSDERPSRARRPTWRPSSSPARERPVRSDIYALGLVLYELYTGKRAYSAGSLEDLRARKAQEMPPAPSELIKDMDPAVERVILRATARDPAARPRVGRPSRRGAPGRQPARGDASRRRDAVTRDGRGVAIE